MSAQRQPPEVEPGRVIHRLLGRIGELELEAAKFAALADQYAERNAELEATLSDGTGEDVHRDEP